MALESWTFDDADGLVVGMKNDQRFTGPVALGSLACGLTQELGEAMPVFSGSVGSSRPVVIFIDGRATHNGEQCRGCVDPR